VIGDEIENPISGESGSERITGNTESGANVRIADDPTTIASETNTDASKWWEFSNELCWSGDSGWSALVAMRCDHARDTQRTAIVTALLGRPR
jgi:hypothetical protein